MPEDGDTTRPEQALKEMVESLANEFEGAFNIGNHPQARDPGSELNEAAVAAMSEVGIDISRELPKPFADEVVQAADVVVTMGCGDACPVIPGKRSRTGRSPIQQASRSKRSALYVTR